LVGKIDKKIEVVERRKDGQGIKPLRRATQSGIEDKGHRTLSITHEKRPGMQRGGVMDGDEPPFIE